MEIGKIMTKPVIALREDETADLAARLLSRNHIGALPVCNSSGKLVGMVTDRDLVTRCIALGKRPEETTARSLMSRNVVAVEQTESLEQVASLMSREQIRRVPVVQGGKLTGIVSLCDLARQAGDDAAEILRQVSAGISRR